MSYKLDESIALWSDAKEVRGWNAVECHVSYVLLDDGRLFEIVSAIGGESSRTRMLSRNADEETFRRKVSGTVAEPGSRTLHGIRVPK